MAEVFISYVRPDKPRAALLVERLRGRGFIVWWDDDIEADQPWEETIERALAEAGAVIVCWSRRSVASENVKAEARVAKREGRLLQVFLEPCEPPLFFGERQGIDLDGALNGPDHPALARLYALLDNLLGRETLPPSTTPAGIAAASSAGAVHRTAVGRRALIGGGVAVVGLAGAGIGYRLLHGAGRAAPASVAVLPFANLSGDPAQRYFSDGLAEELRSALARLPGLTVIGRITSEKLRDADAAAAAAKLGVAHILTGSVRRTASLIRITAQLVSAATGADDWTHSYDSAPVDALALQTRIAGQVAESLSITLGLAEKTALEAGGTSNAVAHDLNLKAAALANANGGEAAYRQALSLTGAALALDPNYAGALATRSAVLRTLGGRFVRDAATSRQQIGEASGVAQRAIAIAPDLLAGYAALGNALSGQLKMRAALDAYQRGRDRGQEAEFLAKYGVLLCCMGSRDEGLVLVRKAVDLDPLNAGAWYTLATSLYFARRMPEALAAARKAIAMNPQGSWMHWLAAEALGATGRVREALDELGGMPVSILRLCGEAVFRRRLGDTAGAAQAFERMLAMGGDGTLYQQVIVRTQWGERDAAFAALDRAWEERDAGLYLLRVDPWLDPLRGDSRFKAVDDEVFA